ncbi:Rv2732c family membrane protein [Parasphingorhabdus pacifica]
MSERDPNQPEHPADQPRISQAGREHRQQLPKAERELLRRIDPGKRALVIAAVMLVLVSSSLMPWIAAAPGWQVLSGQADPALDVGLLPRLFAINSGIAGVGIGAVALVTRRWALAFLAAFTSGIVSFEGLIAIWSRQTTPHAGPSFGLALAVLCMLVLAIQWLRIAWSRS